MKIRYVIVDDDEGQIELLERELKSFPEMVVVKKYSDPKKFLKEHLELKYDVVFLDIDMPGIKGTELSGMIRKPVVFVSAHRKEYSEELLDLYSENNNVIGTINKAQLSDKLKSIIPNIIEKINHSNGTIVLPCFGEKRNFNQNEIILIYTMSEGQERRDKRLLKLKEGKISEGEWVIIKNMEFEKILEKLDTKTFFRLNKFCIVSKPFIDRCINADNVLLKIPTNIKDIDKSHSVAEKQWQSFKDWYER